MSDFKLLSVFRCLYLSSASSIWIISLLVFFVSDFVTNYLRLNPMAFKFSIVKTQSSKMFIAARHCYNDPHFTSGR